MAAGADGGSLLPKKLGGRGDEGEINAIVKNGHYSRGNQRDNRMPEGTVVMATKNQEGVMRTSNDELHIPPNDGIIISKQKRPRVLEENVEHNEEVGRLSNSDKG